MKTSTILLALALSLPLAETFAQEFPPETAATRGRRGGPPLGGGRSELPVTGDAAVVKNGAPLTTFDLDFPGGKPRQLVAAIEKAGGKPLNAIIPDEYSDKQLPALKMKGVNVANLFEALQSASHKEVPVVTGMTSFGGGGRNPSYSYQSESFGFRTQGAPREDSIWYFVVNEPHTPPFLQNEPEPNVCRFYQLAPYLAQDLKVEDITTAVETGWKMLGVKPFPTLNFHGETKLLIAVGKPEQLLLIDQALERLNKSRDLGNRPTNPANPANPPIQKPVGQ